MLLATWNRLRSTYWFIPLVIILGCFGLSYLMLLLDATLPHQAVIHMGWVYTRDPSGARAMLSVVSESVITVAGVVFSVTVVALTMASNQFGTRVLKSFARDTANQVVLGTLLGTFLYGILVMRRVESGFVPSLSVAAGVFLAGLSVFVLVYFIHHLIVELQGENVVASVAHDLRATMETLFPEELGTGGPPHEEPAATFGACKNLVAAAAEKVQCEHEGFVRTIKSDKLLELAEREHLLVRLNVKPGDFVSPYSLLAEVWRTERMDRAERSDNVRSEIQHCVSVGAQRSYEDDIKFGLQQLGFIIVRSLSPAINAIGTALDGLDHLTAGLIRLGNRKIPSRYRRDSEGNLRIITPGWNLQELVDAVLDPIRTAAAGHPVVIQQLLRGLANAASQVQDDEFRRALLEQLKRVASTAEQLPEEGDRRRVHEVYWSLRDHRKRA